jgi:hypothetical protein
MAGNIFPVFSEIPQQMTFQRGKATAQPHDRGFKTKRLIGKSTIDKRRSKAIDNRIP